MYDIRLDLVDKMRDERTGNVFIRIRIGKYKGATDLYVGRSRAGEFDTTNKFDQWWTMGNDLAMEKNKELRMILNGLEATFIRLRAATSIEPTPKEVKIAWQNRIPERPPQELIAFYDVYVKEKNLAPETIESYKTAKVSLKDFLRIKFGQEKDKESFMLHAIDSAFIYKYEHYLAKANGTKGKVYAKGTAQLYLKKLKAVLDHAFHSGEIKVNVAANHKWTGILTEKKTMVSADIISDAVMWKIPKESLHKIEMMPLEGKFSKGGGQERYGPQNQYTVDLTRIRLLFLLQTFTGFAYSDLVAMKNVKPFIRVDLNGTKSIIYNRAKNGELAIVPLFEQTEKLLDALEWDASPMGSYDTYNRKMKALMRYYEVDVPDEEVSTHIGRHLFGSRMVHMGFGMHMISRMMGHTSLAQTEKIYARVDINAINADWERVKILQEPTGTKLAV